MTGHVLAVHRSPRHGFSKMPAERITLLEGLGVEGDAHAGTTVQHRSRVARDPSQPNLRQVHLLHAELLEDLAALGHAVDPGQLGENVTTRGLDLLGLPVGTRLTLDAAVVTVTGLRNPCRQIESFSPGLLRHLVRPREDGPAELLAGVMGIVSRGGGVTPGDVVDIALPPAPHYPLARV